MFIFLSKFLPLLVYPLGAAALLLFCAWIFWKHRRASKVLLIAAFLLIFLGGNRYTTYALARSLEWRYIPHGEFEKSDVIVVLGGATEPHNAPRPTVELNAAADRLFYGATLFHQEKAPRVLLSGGEIEFLKSSEQSPAQDASEILAMLGVSRQNVTILSSARNTYEEAVEDCAWLKKNGYDTALLVTSATHMPRAVSLFQKQGCAVTPAPTDFSITQDSWQRLWHPNFEEFMINLIPNYSNLSLLTKSLKEYIGMAVYRLQGWL